MQRVFAAMLLAMVAPAAAAPAPDLSTLRNLAQTGDAEAQYMLAEAYRVGRGVKADSGMAIQWYRRAADKGHARAGDELGFTLFASGERREAIPFVEKAAARGDARAFYLLGTAHFNGDYVARDWPLAYAQTSRAAEGGIAAARKNLDVMGKYLLAGDRAKADQILTTLPPVRRPGAPGIAPNPPPPPVAPAPKPAAPTMARGAWKAQIGAYGSPDAARAGWRTLNARVPRLGGLEQRMVPAGRVTRLQAVGLASKADADALCREIRRAGGGCFPIAP
ncbi:SPOR domain-containing protein [uncultured Sphingomonas sp.]|uniref:SPOR domain-containing protein n=1 Tax=uncultured Sphingomonas sp. TaxID=158754 RepID=UPI0025DA2255|nr:SPOR domain-containing protein [uncultured Sphingomonas sp.]